jgi:hypothetical protein
MKPESSLPHSLEPAICTYAKLNFCSGFTEASVRIRGFCDRFVMQLSS